MCTVVGFCWEGSTYSYLPLFHKHYLAWMSMKFDKYEDLHRPGNISGMGLEIRHDI